MYINGKYTYIMQMMPLFVGKFGQCWCFLLIKIKHYYLAWNHCTWECIEQITAKDQLISLSQYYFFYETKDWKCTQTDTRATRRLIIVLFQLNDSNVIIVSFIFHAVWRSRISFRSSFFVVVVVKNCIYMSIIDENYSFDNKPIAVEHIICSIKAVQLRV